MVYLISALVTMQNLPPPSLSEQLRYMAERDLVVEPKFLLSSTHLCTIQNLLTTFIIIHV